MSDIRPVLRLLLIGVGLGITVLGLTSVYGDNAEVVSLAKQAACGSSDCTYRTLREQRTPFSQAFTFQVALVEKGKASAGASTDVECTRAYVLAGAYSCKVTGGGLPGTQTNPPESK